MRWISGAGGCRKRSWLPSKSLLRMRKWVLPAVVFSLALHTGRDVNASIDLDAAIVITRLPRQDAAAFKRQDADGLSREDWFAGAQVAVAQPNGQMRVLSDGFAAACDPNVSFDGQRVLFAGRKSPQAPWRIWEIGLDGGALRPVSPENLDARSPIYVSSLFTLDSPEPWFTTVFVGRERSGSANSTLYSIRLEGTDLRRLTFSPNRHFDPVQMSDGRVIYAAERQPLEPGSRPARVGLYSIHIEGADMELYGGEQGQTVQYMPCVTERGLVIFVEPDPRRRDGSGQLACIREKRPHVSYQRLTEDKSWRYLYPSRWHDNVVLAARRPAQGGSWTLWSFDADQRQAKLVLESPGYDVVQAAVVKPRSMPVGHSTVVETSQHTGLFYGLNCYDADSRMAPHMQTGMVRSVRFIEGFPRAEGQATAGADPGAVLPRRLVGEAPVEADGSFNVEVPADTPLLLQTLDQRGLALANCGWIWVKPKEKRGCIGCHEDPERIPENEYVLALRRPSTQLVLPPAERRVVAFREAVAPIFQSHCAAADCHGGKTTPLNLPLGSKRPTEDDLRQAYAALLTPAKKGVESRPMSPGKYLDPGRARTSLLIWQLFGADVSRPWDTQNDSRNSKNHKVRQMPPPGKGTPLSEAELRTVIQWVDMGAPYENATPAQPDGKNATASK